MKKTLIVCDCCGDEIDGMAHIAVEMSQDVWEKFKKKLPKDSYSVLFEDIHEDCVPAIRELFNPTPIEKRVKTGRPATIDSEKVIALRAAGWTIPQIASELKCGKSTIGRILQIEKEAAL